jgi:predicted Fe-Mo cluster-binding NifX family protein
MLIWHIFYATIGISREVMMDLLIAFSTNDGKTMINEHAGQAKYFDVYRFSKKGTEFVERRDNSKLKGDKTLKHGDPKKAQATLGSLQAIHVLVARKFGPNLPRLLKKLLCVLVKANTISDAVEILKKHMEAVSKEYEKGEQRKHLILEA